MSLLLSILILGFAREAANGLLFKVEFWRRELLSPRRRGRDPDLDLLLLIESSREWEADLDLEVTETSNESPVL